VLPLSFFVCTCLCGCAGLWDEIRSNDFQVQTLFVRPDPLVVLRDSSDGDQRAKALRSLQEPKRSGGSDAEQEAVVKVLVASATGDKQPLCRLAAVRTLGRFQDPRAVQGLTDAFYNANAFAPDTATVIRCEALTALGETGNPQAVELLARVAREPQAEGTDQEKQQALDVRIAAARSLGRYNQPQATETLVRVMRTEKNVALRDRAHESLVATTGRRMSPDDTAWDEYLKPEAARQLPPEPGTVQRVLGWLTP
jgi:HEAT repeat protein